MMRFHPKPGGSLWLGQDLANILTALSPAQANLESEWQLGYEAALQRVGVALGLELVDAPERNGAGRPVVTR